MSDKTKKAAKAAKAEDRREDRLDEAAERRAEDKAAGEAQGAKPTATEEFGQRVLDEKAATPRHADGTPKDNLEQGGEAGQLSPPQPPDAQPTEEKKQEEPPKADPLAMPRPPRGPLGLFLGHDPTKGGLGHKQ